LIQRKQQHEGSANHKRTVSSQQWDSHLRMQLPLLGTVEVALTLVDKQLSLRITAPDGHDSLNAHLPALQDRLSALGFNLHTLSLQDTPLSPPDSDAS
ncbi:flagellar hook-length control protein FliK, partial [Alcaligenaceae bacterium 429]